MIPWFQYTVWHLGPIPIQVWGFFVALGMLLSLLIIHYRSERRMRDSALDTALWMIIGGIFFARVFHVVFYEPLFYLAQPVEIIKIWHGGLSSFGGLFGAVVGYFVAVARQKMLSHERLHLADTFAFAAVYGWIIGRLGCVMIHDHLGKPCDCFFAIQAPGGPRLEMSIIEILSLTPLAVLFFLVRKKHLSQGWYVGVLFMYYGPLRFILDFFRATDIPGADTRYFGLTPGQYFGMVLLVIGAWIFWRPTNRKVLTQS